ncbi:MAG: hypothetical protein FWG65_07060 [Turicibacter sp.]|nr:hypothetical protein [Turicibacter sp.]
MLDHELPNYILVCDFEHFHLYNRKRDNELHAFTLNELPQNIHLFVFMAGKETLPPPKNDRPAGRIQTNWLSNR